MYIENSGPGAREGAKQERKYKGQKGNERRAKKQEKTGFGLLGEGGGIVARIVVRIIIERPAVDEGRKKPSIIPNNRQRRGTEP